jgi:hypothetical protein
MSLLQDVLRPTNPRDVDAMAARLNKLSVPDDSPSTSPRVGSPALGIDSSDEDELIGVVSTRFFFFCLLYLPLLFLLSISIDSTDHRGALTTVVRIPSHLNTRDPPPHTSALPPPWWCATFLRCRSQGRPVAYNLEARPEVHLPHAAVAKDAPEPRRDVFLDLFTCHRYLNHLLPPQPSSPNLRQTS